MLSFVQYLREQAETVRQQFADVLKPAAGLSTRNIKFIDRDGTPLVSSQGRDTEIHMHVVAPHKLEDVLRAGLVRYAPGAVEAAAPITSAQAQAAIDGMKLSGYSNGSLYVDVGYSGTDHERDVASHRFTDRELNADFVRRWINTHATMSAEA